MTDLTRDFFYTLPRRNILRSFRGRNLLWHILASGATVGIVSSDLEQARISGTKSLASATRPDTLPFRNSQ